MSDNDTMSLFSKIVDKFRNKPETFQFLLDRNQELATSIKDIYDKYMHLPKFSDLIKEDTREYKSYYHVNSLSLQGYVRTLKKYKFYEMKNVKEDWDIFLPNGYNRIELDLKELKPHNDHQIIFGIQGCDDLVGKTALWNILEKTYGRDGAKELLPETFVLKNPEHMELFRNKYKEGEIYILKSMRQRKQGLKLTKEIKEILKALDKDYTLVQEYKRDLLFVNKRKLNLRIYLLVTTKNNEVKAYINKFGTCIYSNKEYDDSTFDFENNITSYNLDLKVYDNNPMSFKQLRTYLLDQGIENPDKLFDNINNKVSMVIDAVKPFFGKHGNLKNNLCAQIFGMDIIVDKNLNPYLLECNKGPDMSPKNNDSYTKLVGGLEKFYEAEDLVDKSYPCGYKSGNGLKVQKDMFELLNIIKLENNNNGFYQIYG